MAVPVSAGIGTGAAQVFGQDKTYEALKDASGTLLHVAEYKKKEEERKKLEEEEKRKQNLEDNFKMMKLTETDYTKILDVDVPVIQKMAIDFQNKYRGRYEKILTDPVIANEFNQDLNSFNAHVAERIQERDNYLNVADEVNLKNPNHYTQETRDNLLAQRKMAGSKFEMPSRKLNLPTMDDVLKKFDRDVFYAPGFSKTTDEGITSYSGSLKSDEENQKTFFNRLTTEGDFGMNFMQGMQQAYPDLSPEELKDKTWKVFKDSYLAEKDKEYVKTTAEQKDGGAGIGVESKFNIDVRKGDKREGEESVKTILTIGRASGSALSPITYSFQGQSRNGVVSEVYQDKNGKWYANVLQGKPTGRYNEDGDEIFNYTSGETQTVPLTSKMRSHLSSKYGISDLESFVEERLGEKTKLSDEDKEAYDWAMNNQNDPRAKEILKRLQK